MPHPTHTRLAVEATTDVFAVYQVLEPLLDDFSRAVYAERVWPALMRPDTDRKRHVRYSVGTLHLEAIAPSPTLGVYLAVWRGPARWREGRGHPSLTFKGSRDDGCPESLLLSKVEAVPEAAAQLLRDWIQNAAAIAGTSEAAEHARPKR